MIFESRTATLVRSIKMIINFFQLSLEHNDGFYDPLNEMYLEKKLI